MRLNQNQLNNLPVYTKSQDFLGRISGFEFDTVNHQIINYKIGSSSLLRSLLGSENQLIISSQDVISISEEKMIVQDEVIKEENLSSEKILSKSPVPTLQKEVD